MVSQKTFTYNLDLILGVFVIVLMSDFPHILLEYLKPDLFSLGQTVTGPFKPGSCYGLVAMDAGV